jgi:hypothetical protein
VAGSLAAIRPALPRARSRGEELEGGEGADRRAPPVSDGATVTGWQAGSCMEMGWGRRRAGLAAEEMANDDFFQFKSFFQLNKSTRENKIRKNSRGSQKNVKFCIVIDLNICHNFCIGHFDQRSTIFK